MAGPLYGIKVLDLSRILAGPWSTQLLSDLGADVIKVERPEVGDDTRGWGPPFLTRDDGTPTAESAYFLSANRGKRSITVDISSAEGQQILRELVKTADVFVENYKVGDMRRYGLDYAALSEINPCLVYCSITGFGQTGPYSSRAGYDFVIQADDTAGATTTRAATMPAIKARPRCNGTAEFRAAPTTPTAAISRTRFVRVPGRTIATMIMVATAPQPSCRSPRARPAIVTA